MFYRLATLVLAQALDLTTFVLMVRERGVVAEGNPLVVMDPTGLVNFVHTHNHARGADKTNTTRAATKILVDRSSDRIVGAHLLGPEYGELVNVLGLAMKLDLTTRQLKSMTAAYPTVGSDLGSML